jgi:hypothetical protein
MLNKHFFLHTGGQSIKLMSPRGKPNQELVNMKDSEIIRAVTQAFGTLHHNLFILSNTRKEEVDK